MFKRLCVYSVHLLLVFICLSLSRLIGSLDGALLPPACASENNNKHMYIRVFCYIGIHTFRLMLRFNECEYFWRQERQ